MLKNGSTVLIALLLIIFGSILQLWNSQPTYYAQAYAANEKEVSCKSSLLTDQQNLQLFDGLQKTNAASLADVLEAGDEKFRSDQLAKRLYEITGDTPIKEMIPFISRRDERVAAFLIGIAKKESSWGEHVPTQDGQDCFNYWGYKGSASRGSAMGYACFADAKEAVETVGNRIEVLVDKNHTTASKMLVWKCGSSCAGHDPKGVESWVSTVSMYLNKIIG